MSTDLKGFSVKVKKTFRGMEDEGFNAALYLKGKAVADVNDYGTGGPVQVDWYEGKEEVHKLFSELADSLAHESKYYGAEVCLASDLVTAVQFGKKLALKAQRGIVCHVAPGTPRCQYNESRMASTSYAVCLASVKADHPNDIILDPNDPLEACKVIGTLLCARW